METPDGYGKKPVELAAASQVQYEGTPAITKFVIEHSDTCQNSEILIGYSSEDIFLEEVKALLEEGVPVDSLYDNGTALQRAVGNGNLKIVHLLLCYGADPMLDGKYGTALDGAKENYYEPAFLGLMKSFMDGTPKPPYDLEAEQTNLEASIQDAKANELDFQFLNPIKNEHRIKRDLLEEGLLKNKTILTAKLNHTDHFKILVSDHTY